MVWWSLLNLETLIIFFDFNKFVQQSNRLSDSYFAIAEHVQFDVNRIHWIDKTIRKLISSDQNKVLLDGIPHRVLGVKEVMRVFSAISIDYVSLVINLMYYLQNSSIFSLKPVVRYKKKQSKKGVNFDHHRPLYYFLDLPE